MIVPAEAYEAAEPTEKECADIKDTADKVMKRVEEESSKYSEIVDVRFGGSYIKKTWIKDGADIDILVMFKRETPWKIFEDVALKIGFAALKDDKPRTRYAEHPFVEAIVDGTKINVVPCFKVRKGKWKSAADRTPFHAERMTRALKSTKKRTEVRLLKLFLKSNGLYGAEIAKRGFSGYLTESLIYDKETFENVVRYFAGGEYDEPIGKPKKKFDTPVVIVDPID